MKMKKILAIVLVVAIVAALAVAFAACGKEKYDFTFGLITLHDSQSTYDKNFIDAANEAVAQLKKEGVNVKLIVKSGVKEDNTCYDAAIELVEQGCNAIFADSFGHEQFILKAAKAHPEVQFAHATGTMAHTEKLANFHNAFAAIYEGRYLAGIAAGKKLEAMKAADSNVASKIGYIGAYPYEEVKSGYTAFFLGVQSIVRDVTMDVIFTNSWYNSTAEQEGANTLINRGCVLISQHADSWGAPNACEEKNVPDVTYNLSTVDNCPNTYLAGSKINWTPYIKHLITETKNGSEEFKKEYDWTGTIANGAVEYLPINTKIAAAGTQEAIDTAVAAFRAGTLKVFATASFTVNGEHLTEHMANVDSDEFFTPDTQVIENGVFLESYYRSAPYFGIDIDGINNIGNTVATDAKE